MTSCQMRLSAPGRDASTPIEKGSSGGGWRSEASRLEGQGHISWEGYRHPRLGGLLDQLDLGMRLEAVSNPRTADSRTVAVVSCGKHRLPAVFAPANACRLWLYRAIWMHLVTVKCPNDHQLNVITDDLAHWEPCGIPSSAPRGAVVVGWR